MSIGNAKTFVDNPGGGSGGGVSGLTTDSFVYPSSPTTLASTAAATNGQLLIGSTGVAPVATTLTAGSNVTITNSAGGITIGATGTLSSQLNQITAAVSTATINSANNNITWEWKITGGTDGFDITESAASTGTGALVAFSTLNNSTAATFNLTQGSITTAANPGTSAPTMTTIVTGNGGNASSGNTIAGHGGDIVEVFGTAGTYSGTPFSSFASRSLYYTQRSGARRMFSASGWADAAGHPGEPTVGSNFASPTLAFYNPTASTTSVRQEMSMLEWNGSFYNTGAVATYSFAGTQSGYAVGDLIQPAANTCPQQPTWQVTGVSGGAITTSVLYSPPDTIIPAYPNGIPLAGLACPTTSNTATQTNGSGTGATVSILSVGGPTLFRTKLRNFPCYPSTVLNYGASGNNDSACTQITSDPAASTTNSLQQWFGVGNSGGGTWIQGLAGGGSINFIAGNGNITSNGQLGIYGVNTEPVVIFGKFGSLGTYYNSGFFSVDGDNSTTSGALTGVFGTILINGSGGTIADGVPLKLSATANQVAPTTTGDTGAGVVVGVNVGSCTSGSPCNIATMGYLRSVMALGTGGTGNCVIGYWVIVSTTVNGAIQCSSTYPTAGTIIGTATSAQSSTGGKVNVLIGLK